MLNTRSVKGRTHRDNTTRTTTRTIRHDGLVKDTHGEHGTRNDNIASPPSHKTQLNAYVIKQVESQPHKPTTTVEEELEMQKVRCSNGLVEYIAQLKQLQDVAR